MAERRDEELGAVLRELDIPPHGPDFYARLRDRLAAEAAGGVVPSRLESAEEERPKPGGEPSEEAGRRVRTGPGRSRPSQLRPPPSRPASRRPLLVLSAVAAVVLAVLVATAVLPNRDRGPGRIIGPRVASAAEVRIRVAHALATARTLRAELSVECAVSFGECAAPEDTGGRGVINWNVVATAAGDERITPLGPGDDNAYQADKRVQQTLIDPTAHPLTVASEFTNLPAGPPDFANRSLAREYGSVVRSFLESSADAPVIDTTAEGRPAWQLAVPVQPNKLAGPGRSGDRIEVVVDQASGFPLRVTESLGPVFLHELRLSHLVVDAPVGPSEFVLALPAGGPPKVFRQDYGFRAVPLDQVAAAVGYPAVLPATVPPGYRLAEVTVARQSGATGTEGLNPPSRNVVSVAYRRGFDRIVVSTRSTGAERSAWYDPMGTGEGILDQPERFTIARGALAGAAAELVVTARGTPHVWAIDDRLVMTISGDATHDELRAMAESMR